MSSKPGAGQVDVRTVTIVWCASGIVLGTSLLMDGTWRQPDLCVMTAAQLSAEERLREISDLGDCDKPTPPVAPNREEGRDLGKELSARLEYQNPGKLYLGEAVRFEVRIEPEAEQSPTLLIKDPPTVSADLTAFPDDVITIQRAAAEERQPVRSGYENRWSWTVHAVKPQDTVNVQIKIYAHYLKDGKDEKVMISSSKGQATITDQWITDARWFEWTKYKLKRINEVTAILFSIFTAATGLLTWFGIKGAKAFFRTRDTSEMT